MKIKNAAGWFDFAWWQYSEDEDENDLKGEALGVTEKGEASWLGGVLFRP